MLRLDKRVKLEGVAEAVKDLRALDKEIVNQLRRDIRGAIKPFVPQIQNEIPSEAPIRGMKHTGRTAWNPRTRGNVSVTPARRRGKDTYPLVSITLTGAGKQIGFDYAELAGVRRGKPRPMSKEYMRNGIGPLKHRVTTQGDAFITGIKRASGGNYKAGHFGFRKFRSLRNDMQVVAKAIVMKTADKYNKKIRQVR